MNAAAKMTMRATIKRSSGALDSRGGRATPQDWQVVSEAEPCFVWAPQAVQVSDGAQVMTVEEIRGIFRSDADIQAGDVLEGLRDRREREVLAGRLDVTTVTPRTVGAAKGHLAVALRRAQ